MSSSKINHYVTSKDLNLQNTNSSSIRSKCSMEQAGYLTDGQTFSYDIFCQDSNNNNNNTNNQSSNTPPKTKLPKRSPLINRGYWIRVACLTQMIEDFIRKHDGQCMVVSLGCGYDTTWLHLARKSKQQAMNGQFHSNDSGSLLPLLYVDVDFEALLRRKHQLLLEHSSSKDYLYSSREQGILNESEEHSPIESNKTCTSTDTSSESPSTHATCSSTVHATSNNSVPSNHCSWEVAKGYRFVAADLRSEPTDILSKVLLWSNQNHSTKNSPHRNSNPTDNCNPLYSSSPSLPVLFVAECSLCYLEV